MSGEEVRIDSVAAGWLPPGDPEGFSPPLRAGVLPSGAVVYTDSSTYAIKSAVPGGRVTRVLTRPFQPRPVTRRVRADEIERLLEAVAPVRGENPMLQQMREFRRRQIEAMEFFDEIPVVVDLRTSSGRHHLGPSPGGRGRGGQPDRPSFRRTDATWAPSLPAPPRCLPPSGRNGLVAFVERDDLDVSYVSVKRLPEGIR